MNSHDTFHGGLLIISVLGLVAIAGIGGTSAQAGESLQPQTTEVHVSYHRQELADPKAAAHLFQQLQQASRKVCNASYSRNDSLENYARWQACYRQTLHDAIARIDSPVLLAMWNGKKGGQG
ncbi:MAG TPA: UrcA family protein [Steroidobacteraceae bacterium]|nr:UrcA family protein [Steroidobacteraceae bacterium]